MDKALVQTDGQGGRLLLLQTIHEYARERLGAAGEESELSRRHARRYAQLARELRDGIEGTDQLRVPPTRRGRRREHRGSARHAPGSCAGRRRGRGVEGLQLCGDLWMYWHMRGKNLTQRRYVVAFLGFDRHPTVARVGRAPLRRDRIVGVRGVRAGERRVGRGLPTRVRTRSRTGAVPRRHEFGPRLDAVRCLEGPRTDGREHRVESPPRLHLGRRVRLDMRWNPAHRGG